MSEWVRRPGYEWFHVDGQPLGSLVHEPNTCRVCDDNYSNLLMVARKVDEPWAPLAEAPGIREDLRDAGPLGVEIEEFQAQEARKFYAIPAEEQAKIDALDAPNPKQRFGDLKVALQLVPPALAIHAAKALKEGADKYGAYNWRTQPVEAMTYIGGLLRHAAAYLDGEDIDPESSTGKTHLDGMAANIAILLDALDLGTLIDNRPPKGPAPKLVRTPK